MNLNPLAKLDSETYPVAVLCKERTVNARDVEKHYLRPLVDRGLLFDEVAVYPLDYGTKDKAPIKVIRAHLSVLLPNLAAYETQYILVNDGAYFKELTGQKKADANLGYVLPCAYEGFEHMHVILGANYKSFYVNPAGQAKLDQGLHALISHIQGEYIPPGTDLLENYDVMYREDADTQKYIEFLKPLLDKPEIEADIEAFSLKFYHAGLATVAFSYDDHSAIALQADYSKLPPNKTVATSKKGKKSVKYGTKCYNPEIRKALRWFFETYEGIVTYHNGNYDIKVLIYELYMSHLQDYEGMLKGLDILTKNIDDTKIIRYLATNSCAGNKLGLKDASQEFTGNYAEDEINDVCKIPLDSLLKYNAVDCLATRYVKRTHYPIMVADEQLNIYEEIFKPSIRVLLQAELVGMPLCMDTVLDVRDELTGIRDGFVASIQANRHVVEFMRVQRNTALIEKNLSLVRTVKTIADFEDMQFNPNSSQQVAKLLHTELGLPVAAKTKTGAPSVGGDELKKMLNTYPDLDDDLKALFKDLISYAEIAIIVSTFVTAFIENSVKKQDGIYWLHGSFNLGGTVSGRLSSKAPNLQNIPSSGNPYAKHIKRCFKAPPGYVNIDKEKLRSIISTLD